MSKNTVVVSILADSKNFASGMKDATGGMGKLGNLAGAAVKTVAGVGAAIAGIAIAGGFARAMKIDEARTQLSALGYSGAQVEDIMKSALTSVKGTAYSLGDASTIAAQALASGVKPGQELTSSLKTVANVAALAKTDMGDMGNVFAKVWANGKVTTREMNELADRGVPVWQTLSQSFGVSNSQLRKMVESGQVTSDMFMNSLGPSVDGMATKMSGSFKGMVKNAFAALSRVGELFAAPLLNSAKGFLGTATDLADKFGTMLKPVADKFAAFVGSFDSKAIGQFMSQMISGVSDVAKFVGQFSPLSMLFHALAPVLPQIGGAVGNLAAALGQAAKAAAPLVAQALGPILALVAGLVPIISWLVTGVINVVAAVISWVSANGDIFRALTVVAAVIAVIVVALTTFKAIQLGVQAAMMGAQVATYLSGTSLATYNAIQTVTSAGSKIAAAAQWAWNAALSANPIAIVVIAIAALVAGLVYFFTQTKLGQEIWTAFCAWLTQAWQTLAAVCTAIWNAIAAYYTGIWNGMVNGVRTAVGFITNIIGGIQSAVMGALGNVGSWLVDTGKNLIQGLINGIGGAMEWLKKTITGLGGKVVDWVKGVFGIHSPSRVFKGIGGNLGAGLSDGIAGTAKLVAKTTRSLAGTVIDAFDGSLGGDLSVSASGTAGITNNYNVTVSTLNANAETGRVIVEAIHDYEDAGGRA